MEPSPRMPGTQREETLYELLESTRFTGVVRGTDVLDRQGKRIVSTFIATFEDSVMTGFSSATFIVDDRGVREIKIDEEVARREMIVKMLSKPVSSLEVVRKTGNVEVPGESEVKKVSREEWEAAKKIAHQILNHRKQGERETNQA